jgi:hypothetical protein
MDKRELLESLKAKVKELGRVPQRNEIDWWNYVRVFGSWAEALDAIGYRPTQQARPRVYTDKELLQNLRQYAEELGCTPRMIDMKKPSAQTYIWRFGSWSNACKLAGLPQNAHTGGGGKKYDKKDVCRNLYKRYVEYGRPLKWREIEEAEELPSVPMVFKIMGCQRKEELWKKVFEEEGGLHPG